MLLTSLVLAEGVAGVAGVAGVSFTGVEGASSVVVAGAASSLAILLHVCNQIRGNQYHLQV